MSIVGGLDIHRKQLTFDYPGTASGEVRCGQVTPADRAHLRSWLARFTGRNDVAFALEGCTGWRYVAEELAGAGVTVHVAEPADTAFARGRKRHAKTDKTDSRHLVQWRKSAQHLEYVSVAGEPVEQGTTGSRGVLRSRSLPAGHINDGRPEPSTAGGF